MRVSQKTMALTLTLLSAGIYDCLGQFRVQDWTINETFADKLKQKEPAKLLINIPSDPAVSETYVVNAAMGVSFLELKKFNFSVLGEWHRNTQIEKKQHVQQFGGNIYRSFEFDTTGVSFTIDLSLNGKYSHDLIANTETGIYTAYLTPYWQKSFARWDWIRPGTVHPNGASSISKFIQFEYLLTGGVEHLRRDNLWLSNGSGQLKIYPFSRLLSKWLGLNEVIVLSAGKTWRGKINDSATTLDIGDLFQYGIAIQYKINSNSSIYLGFDRSEGPDPLVSLANQKFSQITLKGRMKI